MIDRTTLRAIGRGVAKRYAPERAALLAEFTAARAHGALDLVAFFERAESMADRQADAVVATARPLLTRVRVTPMGRQAVDDALIEIRGEVRKKLLPGGMTAADARDALAEAEAKDDEILGLFAAALGEDDDRN